MPDTPLQDRNSLETTFNQYTGNTINQPEIPNVPYQSPVKPKDIFAFSGPKKTPLQEWEESSKDNQGKLAGGSTSMPFKDLTNARFSSFDPTPGVDNEDAFARSQGFWDKAANGTIKMLGIAGNTAVSSTLGAINGLAQWSDTGKFSSFYDNEFTHKLDDQMNQMEQMFPHFKTGQQRSADWYSPVNLFTANFVFDSIVKNLGYSLGASVPALGIGKALNALKLSSRLFAAGEALAATETIEAATALPRVQQLGYMEGRLQTIVSGGKTATGNILKGLGAESIGSAEQGGHLVQGIASALSSSGEASMEAYNNLNQFRNERIKEYKDKNGFDPEGADLEAINRQAENVGNSSYLLNTALLTGTQYVQLPKIFSSTFKGEKNLLNATIQDAETGLFRSALPDKGLGKILYKAKNIVSLGFNEAEAFEEGAQYAIQTGTQDYYNKKYRGKDANFLSSLGYGLGEALTTSEGLENIFLGGLSGALMTSGFISRQGIGKTGKIGERGWTGYGGQKATNTDEFIKGANQFQFAGYLKDGVDQANRALTLQEQREAAIRQGDILESKDLEFDYSHNYLTNKIKWGRYDLVEQDIADARIDAGNPQTFAKLQQDGKAAQTDTPQTFIARLNNFQEHAKNVKEQYEDLNTKYGGLIDKEGKKIYSPEVIDKLVYAASKVRDYDKRIPELSTDLLAKGIQIQNVLEDVLKLPITERAELSNLTEYEKKVIQAEKDYVGEKKEPTPLRQALKDIKDLSTVSEVKDDLRQKLQDVIELTQRRKQYINDYDTIKGNPKRFEDIPVDNKARIKQVEEGKTINSELEVGKTYTLASDGLLRDGNKLSINPTLTIISKTLSNTYEVKKPDGSTTFMTPQEFKRYSIKEVQDNPEELNKILDETIDASLKKKGFDNILPEDATLQDKLDFINTLRSKTLVDDIQANYRENSKVLQQQLAEKKAKEEKFKKDQELQKKFEATVKALDSDENTEDPEAPADVPELGQGFKVDLEIIARTGTSQKYEDTAPDSPTRREHTFLFNKSKGDFLERDIKTILVTKNTEEHLGLKGIIDPLYPDTIRIVYVETLPDGTFTYLDKDGIATTNVDEMAYGTMRDESLSFSGGDSFRNPSDLDPEVIKKNYAQFRKSILELTDKDLQNPSDYFIPFKTSRGLPNTTQGNKTNLLDTGIIKKEDLFTPLIQVPTRGRTTFGEEGDTVNMPLGKVIFNHLGNMFFMNSRNLSNKEASNISDILIKASEELTSTGEISPRLSNYLRGVLFFKDPAKVKQRSRNQVFFTQDKLIVGNNELDLFSLNKEQLTSLLEGVYTYVDNKHLLDFAKAPTSSPFEELYLEAGEVKGTMWPSYQHYLLEPRPQGAPLTTTIIKPVDKSDIPIVQKYPILDIASLKQQNSPVPTTTQQKVEAKVIEKEEPKGIVYDNKTVNTAYTSKNEPISFTTNGQEIEIIKNDSSDAVYDRLIKAGMTPEAAKAAISGTVSNTILKDKTQTQQEVEQKEVDIEVVKDLYIKMKGGKMFTEFTPEEQLLIDKYLTKEVRESVDNPNPVADIERRRQEELKDRFKTNLELISSKNEEVTQRTGVYSVRYKENGPYIDFGPRKVPTQELFKIYDEINAKYDAELAALNIGKRTFTPKTYDGGATRLNIKALTLIGDKLEEDKEVERMLPQVKVQTVDNLINVTGGGKAWGYTLPHFIAVWEDAPYGVKYHESFEQVFNFILNNRGRKELYNEFKSREGNFTTFEGIEKAYKDATLAEAKEEIADEFAQYKTDGTLIKPTPAKKNFFQQLLAFLKNLFTGKPLSVEKAFYNLAKGGYANARITSPIKIQPEYKRTVVNTPESLVQDTIVGMTTQLFLNKWEKDASLIQQLEENEQEATKTLFEQLYIGLDKYFTSEDDNSLYAYLSQEAQKDSSKTDQLFTILDQVQANWKNVQMQWGNYAEDLKSFLKSFDVAFTIDDDGNVTYNDNVEEDREERSQSDYNSESKLFLNSKNSASKTIKLLFATVVESKFVFDETANKIGQIVSKYTGNLKQLDNNQMMMPNLASYAKLFNYTLDNAANLNGIEKIIEHLRSVSSNRNVPVNANLEVLLNRLGYDNVATFTPSDKSAQAGEHIVKGWESLDDAGIKILLKFENALSKSRPEFFVQYSDKNDHKILATNISDKAAQLKTEWVENMQSARGVVSDGNRIKFNRSILNKDPFVVLANLGIPITEQDFNNLPKNRKAEFTTALNKLVEDVKEYTSKFLPINAKYNDLSFNSRLGTLADIYSKYIVGNTVESQHSNANGEYTANKILPNYMAYIFNDANASQTLEEFKQLNPQYNDLYMGDSYYLNEVVFSDGTKTNFDLKTVISEGRKSPLDGAATSSLTQGERLVYEINNNLNEIYYSLLPADSSTEWGLRLKNILPKTFFTSKEATLEDYTQKMWSALKNEIGLAKDFESRKNIENLNRNEDGRKLGESLRFFQGILSKELVQDINELIDLNEDISEDMYPKFKEELSKFIEGRAKDTIKTLKEFKLIREKTDKFDLAGVDTKFLKEVGKLTQERLDDLFFFREANYIFNNIELHKLLFNDPYQYKDAEKRIKSFLSGREYSNQSEKLNEVNNTRQNKSGDYTLQPTDFGYLNHSNNIRVQTVRNVFIQSNEVDAIKEAIGKKGDAYDNTDVADAQSWMEPTVYKQTLLKAGGRWESKQEELHQWLMAYQRNSMLEKGQLEESKYPKALQAADKQILKKSINDATLQILKPIASGVKMENGVATQYLYKTSTAPLYYYFVEGTPAEQILLNMQKNNIGMLAMESSHKVGVETNKIQDLFDEQGNIQDFTTHSDIDYKYFGIQVETKGTKDYQTQGSQLTKLALQNLMNMGVPINTTKKEWDKLTEEQKLQNPIYKLVKKHNELLSTMAIRRSEKLFKELNIKKGEFGYTIEDKKKVADFILKELERRELPNNFGVGIETVGGEFKTPLEANVNYKKIKQILWSTIENNILRPKVSGGPKILLTALGYDNIVPKTINGKTVLTSSKLKFYTKDGGKTKACQIAIPFFFGVKILNQIEKSQGIKFKTQKEGFKHVLDYLNNTEEGRSLLEGIGFRIPTQALNSVDFFEIADFLPPQMGDTIIFPSEITSKAGSDFDVDKMSTYLKNFYIDNNGYPEPVKYIEDETARIQYFTDLFIQNVEEKIGKVQKSITSTFNLQSTLSELILGDKAQSQNKWSGIFSEMFPGATATDIETELMDRMEASGAKLKDLNNWDTIQNILLDKFLEDKEIEGLENEYYNTIRDLASLEENYARLVTPNDASQLKDIARDIEKKKNTTKYSLSDAARLLDSSYMSFKRHLFLIMKKGVGIAAVGNTNLALNQIVDFKMAIPKSLIENFGTNRNFAVRFDYNKSGDGLLHLSGTQNKLGDWLSDLHSQVIDGTVDVAKDEWLATLIGDPTALSPLLFMFKLGISPRTAAYFLNQPAIQDYLRSKGIHKNISRLALWVKPKMPTQIEQDIQKTILGKYSRAEQQRMWDSKPEIYKGLEDTIGKSYTELTKEEQIQQIQMLSDYIGFEKLASNLFTAVDAYNVDTTSFTSPEVVDNKELAYQKATKLKPIEGEIDNLMENTFLGGVKQSMLNANEGLSSVLNTQRGEAKRALDRMLLKLYTQFFSMQNRIKYQERAELSLIDFVINTQAEVGQQPINSQAIMQALLFKTGNISDFVRAAQEHPILKNNKILQNIQAIEEAREGYPSYIKLKEQDYDTYTSNLWTDSLKELRDANIIINVKGNDRTSAQLLDAILLSQILQYGSTRSKGSFLHLIPNDKYSELVSPVLRNIKNAQAWADSNYFYRNNWKDSILVPEAQLDFVEIEPGRYERVIPKANSVRTYLDYKTKKATFVSLKTEFPEATFIHQPVSSKNLPFIKITDLNSEDKKTDLYQRVDAEENAPIQVGIYDEDASTGMPYSVYSPHVLYVKVNKLGNENLKEYTPTSKLAENKPVPTPDMDSIAAVLSEAKIIELTNLTTSEPEVIDEEPEVETKTISSATAKRMDAKELYKQVNKLDSPTDSYGLALEYFAGGGKISPETFYNEVVAKRDSRLAPKQVTSEIKNKDFVVKGAKSIKEIAHSIWENLHEDIQDKIDDSSIRDELINIAKDFNTRFSAAQEYIDKYSDEFKSPCEGGSPF